MKSYGRAPTFLALTGYEQVRWVTAAVAGGAGLDDAPGGSAEGGCCGPVEVALGAPGH